MGSTGKATTGEEEKEGKEKEGGKEGKRGEGERWDGGEKKTTKGSVDGSVRTQGARQCGGFKGVGGGERAAGRGGWAGKTSFRAMPGGNQINFYPPNHPNKQQTNKGGDGGFYLV